MNNIKKVIAVSLMMTQLGTMPVMASQFKFKNLSTAFKIVMDKKIETIKPIVFMKVVEVKSNVDAFNQAAKYQVNADIEEVKTTMGKLIMINSEMDTIIQNSSIYTSDTRILELDIKKTGSNLNYINEIKTLTINKISPLLIQQRLIDDADYTHILIIMPKSLDTSYLEVAIKGVYLEADNTIKRDMKFDLISKYKIVTETTVPAVSTEMVVPTETVVPTEIPETTVSTDTAEATVPVVSTDIEETTVPVVSTDTEEITVPAVSTDTEETTVPVVSTEATEAAVPVVSTEK
ncbi:MAG: hypothetical protein ACI8WT_000732 [Clostridium sp.]|jgi:hypothetical protein